MNTTTMDSTSNNGPDPNHRHPHQDPPPPNNPHHDDHDHRFVVDIRLFLALIVISMTISFGLGVAMGPSAEELIQATLAQQQQQQQQYLYLPPHHPHPNPHDTRLVSHDPHLVPSLATPTKDTTNMKEEEEEEYRHEPAGQHLLVDLKGIDGNFLDSEERLTYAMEQTVLRSGLTLLSYHCHKLIPKGVSCVGVLLESHISFHTWPDEGVITLDLFTCGNKPLIPVVRVIKELFGIPRTITSGIIQGEDNDSTGNLEHTKEEVFMQWSHELRGFRNKDNAKNDENNYALLDHNSDLSQMVWSPIDCAYKEQVLSKLTKYQRVDIWDIIGLEETPNYKEAQLYNLTPNDPRWMTHEIVSPRRYFFLDGVLQSESSSDHEYHEALVHPTMFTHPNPKRIAIVGGAEGASLREVFKHNTVESVTQIEIDEELISILREYMPAMSNCSDLLGRADNCFDDPKLHLIIDDAKEWFVNHYQQLQQNQNTQEEPLQFDVVIVDALEPEMGSPISKDLYDSSQVLESIMKSLTPDGVMAIQIGRAPTILDPRPDLGLNAPRERLFQGLEALEDVQAMFVYEDPNGGFLEPRAFLVVCKSKSCRKRFYATADEMDYYIYERVVRTHSKERALLYFDGVTHLGYQVAPKAWETIYCRREPTPFECAYRHLDFKAQLFDYNIEKESDGAFAITGVENEKGEIIQTFVHALVDIPKGSYIMPEHVASPLILSHEAIWNLKDTLQYDGVTIIEDFVQFITDYGHESKAAGSERTIVEVGASYLIRVVDNEQDANVGRWLPPHPNGKRPKYSPVYERHRLSFDVFMIATKDIPKGTELLRFKGMWDAE